MTSIVYVIGPDPLVPESLVKIGTTQNLVHRLKTFQAGSPVRLAVFWAVPGGREIELWLHQEFSAERMHGEWFRLGPDPVKAIQDRLGPFMVNVIPQQVRDFPIFPQGGLEGDDQDLENEDLDDTSRALLTTAEAADLAGVPVSTVRTWKHREQLVPVSEDPCLYTRESVIQRIRG